MIKRVIIPYLIFTLCVGQINLEIQIMNDIQTLNYCGMRSIGVSNAYATVSKWIPGMLTENMIINTL